MPQSSEVVRHTPFCAPPWGVAVSETPGEPRSVSETQPGPTSGTTESSNPALTSTFCPVNPSVVNATLSNCAVLSVPGSWLVTANPVATVDGIAIVTEPTVVHAAPSADIAPVYTLPLSVNFSHTGKDALAPAMNDIDALSLVRAMNSIPPSGFTSRITRRAFGVNSPMIRPAFANGSVCCSLTTRAVSSTMPPRVTAEKESADPQMSEPSPLTKNVPVASS